MLSKTMVEQLNDQINLEFFSSNLYLQMSAWCEDKGFEGAAEFLRVHAVEEKESYPVPPIFGLLAKTGNIEEQMMYNTYNMGLGMIVAVDPVDVDKTMEAIREAGDTPYVVGHIETGEKGVTLC